MDTNNSPSEACVRAWHLLSTVHQVVERKLEAELHGQCGLMLTELEALVHIRSEESGMRQAEVTSCTSLSQPAISRMMERLEQRGLVERTMDPIDRRAVRLSLTPAGTEIANKGVHVFSQTVQSALDDILTAEQQQAIIRIFEETQG